MLGNRRLGMAAGGLAALVVLAAAGPGERSPGVATQAASDGAAAASETDRASASSSAAASARSRVSAHASSSATARSGIQDTECSSEAEASVTRDGVRKTVRQARRITGKGGGCTASSSAEARGSTGGVDSN